MIDLDWPHGFEAVFKRASGNDDIFSARLICRDLMSDSDFHLVFLVCMKDYEEMWCVDSVGRVLGYGDRVIIRQKPEPAKTFGGWVNIYDGVEEHTKHLLHRDKESADLCSKGKPGLIACVYVEGTYKVGDNLS